MAIIKVWGQGIRREVVAQARNYRQVAVLRRALRTKYGMGRVSKLSALMSAVVAVAELPWMRFAIFSLLLVVASRGR